MRIDDAMFTRNANVDFLRDIVVRMPQLIDATLEDSDPLNNAPDDIFDVGPDSQHGCMERSRRIISQWNRMNVQRVALTPSLPELTIGATTVAMF